MEWTTEAKKDWDSIVSTFNSTDQANIFQQVKTWATAVGNLNTRRFAIGKYWCEVTVEYHKVIKVVWNM